MSDMRSDDVVRHRSEVPVVYHFSRSNPDGPDRGNTVALLRSVADSIEALGRIEVEDIVYGAFSTTDDLFVTVYYTVRTGDTDE